jgi:hypothetical protein
LIPRYITGDQNISGAGATASGLSMLMNAAARGIKRVIYDMDQDVVAPSIRDIYIYNMIHGDDDNCKGDAQIVPRGAVAKLVKEQNQLRLQEFLAMTNNPTDMEIIGIERRANLLRAAAKDLGVAEDDAIPPKDELKMRQQQAMQEQMSAQQMDMPTGPVPQEMNQ